MAEINAGLKKAILDEIKRRLDGSPMGGGKPPTLKLEINVKIPHQAQEKPKSTTEQVGERLGERAAAGERQQGNVWLTQEAAKQGFFGGLSLTEQMRNRFVQAGMGLQGLGGAFQYAQHYTGLMRESGGVVGGIGGAVGMLIGPLAASAGIIHTIFPLIRGMISDQMAEVERAAKAAVAIPKIAALDIIINNPFSSAEQVKGARAERALIAGGIGEKTNHLEKSMRDAEKWLANIQAELVKLKEGVAAAMATAVAAAMRGNKPTTDMMKNAYETQGEYAAWKFKADNDWEIWKTQAIGEGAVKFMGEIRKAAEGQLR